MRRVERTRHGVGISMTCFLLRKILGRSSLFFNFVTVAITLQKFIVILYISDLMSTLSTFVYLNIRPRYLTARLAGLQRHISMHRVKRVG